MITKRTLGLSFVEFWKCHIDCQNVMTFIIIVIIRVFCLRTGPSLQAQEPRLQLCRRQVFYRRLRKQGCSFGRGWIDAVVSQCFPHPTLSLASEQTLKDLKRSQGTNVEMRIVDLANWALRTSPKFTAGVKYQFHQGFWWDQRSGNPLYDFSTVYSRFWKYKAYQFSIQLVH